jgi:hypothetical protein
MFSFINVIKSLGIFCVVTFVIEAIRNDAFACDHIGLVLLGLAATYVTYSVFCD